ncbi:MAG: carbon-nitrogen hydrolase family protein [Bacteroidia bacterium]
MKIAIVQYAPEYLNLAGSVEKAGELIQKAKDLGANLVVFGEGWLSGYPVWLDYCPEVALWDHPGTKKVFARLRKNSPLIPGKEIEKLGQWARKYEITLVMGANERIDTGPGNGTLFNSLIIIGPDGTLLNHHRKLMPTYTEKMVHGLGDANGLKPVNVENVQIGGLICWEHWMPHARQALHNQGEHIHIAAWPNVHEMHQVASRHYAFEGRCFVVAAGQILQAKDLPEELELPANLANNPNQFVLKGGSCVIGPDGKYITEPIFECEKIIIADIDPEKVYEERMTLDVSGHYQRNDIFSFEVNNKRRT